MTAEYDPTKDAIGSYYAAIEAKRARGDSPVKRAEVIGDCALFLGDSADILPIVGRCDAVLTDPPYGIKRARGMGGDGYNAADRHIIWGGNYFSDFLPVSQKWLWWDKLQTMPSYSDGELAWTSLDGASTKKFTYNGSGLMAKEQDRQHPTQKPLELMKWCLGFLPDAKSILDPFLGSGTTLVACAKLGRRGVGIEIDPAYFDIACERVRKAYAQPDMFIEAARQEPKQEAFII